MHAPFFMVRLTSIIVFDVIKKEKIFYVIFKISSQLFWLHPFRTTVFETSRKEKQKRKAKKVYKFIDYPLNL